MKQFITFFEIAAFLASLAAWKWLRRSRYMRLFPLLLLIIVITEIYETFFRSVSQVSNAYIYNVQVPVQDLLYLLILYYSTEHVRYRRYLVISSILYIAFCVFSSLLLTQESHFNILSYVIGSILVIVGILIKFYEMLKTPSEFNFLRNPFFYMLFAFLLFNVGTLPYFTMINWFAFFKPDRSSMQIFSNVMSVLNYILYTTYTIVFLWIISKNISL